jgi:hypothetical protein
MTRDQYVNLLWQQAGMDRPREATEGQTREQAVNFSILSFQYICTLEGIEPPSEAAVRERLARARRPI